MVFGFGEPLQNMFVVVVVVVVVLAIHVEKRRFSCFIWIVFVAMMLFGHPGDHAKKGAIGLESRGWKGKQKRQHQPQY